MQLAVIWHWYLPVCMHIFLTVCPFHFHCPFPFFNFVFLTLMERLTIPCLCCKYFTTRAVLKGLSLPKVVFDVCVCMFRLMIVFELFL